MHAVGIAVRAVACVLASAVGAQTRKKKAAPMTSPFLRGSCAGGGAGIALLIETKGVGSETGGLLSTLEASMLKDDCKC